MRKEKVEMKDFLNWKACWMNFKGKLSNWNCKIWFVSKNLLNKNAAILMRTLKLLIVCRLWISLWRIQRLFKVQIMSIPVNTDHWVVITIIAVMGIVLMCRVIWLIMTRSVRIWILIWLANGCNCKIQVWC